MSIIARRTLREFVDSLKGQKDQKAVKAALGAWFAEVSKAKWKSSSDIRKLYATASIVSSERIVFNIKGNDYRLVVAVDFEKSIVWIKWLGTHKPMIESMCWRSNMAKELKPIRTKADYDSALAEVEVLWGSRSGTPKGDRLDILATLIE